MSRKWVNPDIQQGRGDKKTGSGDQALEGDHPKSRVGSRVVGKDGACAAKNNCRTDRVIKRWMDRKN